MLIYFLNRKIINIYKKKKKIEVKHLSYLTAFSRLNLKNRDVSYVMLLKTSSYTKALRIIRYVDRIAFRISQKIKVVLPFITVADSCSGDGIFQM